MARQFGKLSPLGLGETLKAQHDLETFQIFWNTSPQYYSTTSQKNRIFGSNPDLCDFFSLVSIFFVRFEMLQNFQGGEGELQFSLYGRCCIWELFSRPLWSGTCSPRFVLFFSRCESTVSPSSSVFISLLPGETSIFPEAFFSPQKSLPFWIFVFNPYNPH